MKTFSFFLSLVYTGLICAQINSTPNTGTTPVPINPGQTGQQYNGTNPAGEPNQIQVNPSATPGQNSNSNGGYQPAVKPNPVTPISPAVPTPTANPYKNINRLFQDPSRTPSEPKLPSNSKHADGSRGTFHKPKKAMSGSTFAHNKIGVKKAKSHGDNAPEKSAKPAESTR